MCNEFIKGSGARSPMLRSVEVGFVGFTEVGFTLVEIGHCVSVEVGTVVKVSARGSQGKVWSWRREFVGRMPQKRLDI